jgi:transcriptional regulator GlxA family with amidase domain
VKEIAVLLFDNFETLDAFGPVEVLGRMKEHFTVRLHSSAGGIVTSSQGVPVQTEPLPEGGLSPGVLLIPGGIGTRELVKDGAFIDSLKGLAERAEYVLTVCTGSILFSKTGMLDGKRATSNKRVFAWAPMESPAVHWVRKARWVREGNIYTSSGISAGIDMTLGFVADLLGREIARRQADEIEFDWNEDPSRDPFSDLY